MQTSTEESPKKFKLPHVFIILFSFIILVSVLSYIVSVGEYSRIPGPEGRMVLDPNSYHQILQSPVTLLQVFTAIPQGIVDAGWILVLTFCVGGAFGVISKTGTLEIVIAGLAKKFAKRGIIVIPALMLVFATIDTFIGMPELDLVYIPIIMPLIIALGFDSITAAAIPLLGSMAGFTASLTNPFLIGISQKICEVPLYSGILFRVVCFLVTVPVAMLYVWAYARKIRKNPELSEVYMEDAKKREMYCNKASDDIAKASTRQKLVGLAIIALFGWMVFGILKYEWDIPQMGGMFMAIGIISGIIGGLSGDEICDAFVEGCKDVLLGALLIGAARGITVVMTQGKIIDSVVHGLAMVLSNLPGEITGIGVLIMTALFNFIVSSGSGKAVILMPILSPLADVVHISKNAAILAYQYGDGSTMTLWPTSGYFMACLAVAGVSWTKWVKFYWKCSLMILGLGAILLVIAGIVSY